MDAQHHARRLTRATALALAVVLPAAAAAAQNTRPAPTPRPAQRPAEPAPTVDKPTETSTNLPGHPSPPQPTQEQALDYFLGSWTFEWVGRESPLTMGPRTGTVEFTRLGDTPFASMHTAGTVDGGGPYAETGVVGWSDTGKILAVHERLATGVDMLSLGDWSSPLSIRFQTEPVQTDGHTVRLRRVYSVISGESFTVTDELSTDGGAFQRLGTGRFNKSVPSGGRP